MGKTGRGQTLMRNSPEISTFRVNASVVSKTRSPRSGENPMGSRANRSHSWCRGAVGKVSGTRPRRELQTPHNVGELSGGQEAGLRYIPARLNDDLDVLKSF